MRYYGHTNTQVREYLQTARYHAAQRALEGAVSEILAAAIVCDDETAAQVMTGLAEHLARRFDADTMEEVKARAVEIAQAAPTEGDDR
jgi:hypothetical protein